MSNVIDRVTNCAAAASAMLVLMSLPASAQGGTTAQRTACMADVLALCSSAIPDEGRIETCLRVRSARVSEACRMILNPPASVERIAIGSARRSGGQ